MNFNKATMLLILILIVVISIGTLVIFIWEDHILENPHGKYCECDNREEGITNNENS